MEIDFSAVQNIIKSDKIAAKTFLIIFLLQSNLTTPVFAKNPASSQFIASIKAQIFILFKDIFWAQVIQLPDSFAIFYINPRNPLAYQAQNLIINRLSKA